MGCQMLYDELCCVIFYVVSVVEDWWLEEDVLNVGAPKPVTNPSKTLSKRSTPVNQHHNQIKHLHKPLML